MNKVLTKTYTLIDTPLPNSYCSAEVLYDGYSGGEEVGICTSKPTTHIIIETITIEGKYIRNNIGFCDRHLTRKYKKWFKLNE